MDRIKILVVGFVFLGIIIFAVIVSSKKTSNLSLGSVVTGSDYYATSTRNYDGTPLNNFTVVKKGFGALNRVTITGAGTGIIRLWDATTTDAVTGRSSVFASTSILIATIPASAAAASYDYDVTFNNGLLYELVSGSAPTSTIVYR